MPTDQRERLASIRRFDQLVAYLRDELGWPIDSDDFEELTFEYTPEELGIDAKKPGQDPGDQAPAPARAEPALGHLLRQVRAEAPARGGAAPHTRPGGAQETRPRPTSPSAKPGPPTTCSSCPITARVRKRRIAFAHFSKSQEGHDLPTLKVLGWDNLDTALHLDDIARELTDHLTWPDDEDDLDAWRERWRGAFKLGHREVISTSKELSERLAALARAIRDRIWTALAIETESGRFTKLMKAFQTALVHDLDRAGFADMYAQTIAYGLLSARITDPARRTADDFAAHMRTNPFLRELMETFLRVGGRRGRAGGPGIDFDELGVSEVVELLDQANMEAVVRDFGDRNPQEDPVIHFYEHFLAAYDKKQKVSRGVFLHPASGGLLHRALGGRALAQRVRPHRRPRRRHDVGRDGKGPRRYRDPRRHAVRPGFRPDPRPGHGYRHLPCRGDRPHPQDDGREVETPKATARRRSRHSGTTM